VRRRILGAGHPTAGPALSNNLLWGGQDRIVSVRVAESAGSQLGWPLHLVEDAGHAPHIEQPAAFLATLTDALARLPR
jgi:pimeloyl-ACP methyl ester carboxylesterase